LDLFEVSAILLTACAIGSFINYKWVKLPSSIALLLLAMMIGLLGFLLRKAGLINSHYIAAFLSSINFKETVFHGMLSFFLFSGALQINIDDIKAAKFPIAVTATISTLLSTIIIGLAFYVLANLLGFNKVSLLYAILFGAILSPTDPISVLTIFKKMHASKRLETIITGESLFNDGVAIVLYLTILELINAGGEISTLSVVRLLIQEVGGGILFGMTIGWIAYEMVRRTDSYQVELFITLAVTTGGYVLADKLNISAPLAMVTAGIIIGNHDNSRTMSDQSLINIDSFWEAINEILNAVLFFLIGLEMMVINADITVAILGLSCILVALVARYISIFIPFTLLKQFYYLKHKTVIILTWAGLRGALSIAMVLSLQDSMKELFLPCIYFVVIFSIAVQGLTLSRVLKIYDIGKV
jgi:CPA1 family monovalent cation:H+ antiporter